MRHSINSPANPYHTLTSSGYRHNGDCPTCPACKGLMARREAGIRAAQDNLGWLARSGGIPPQHTGPH